MEIIELQREFDILAENEIYNPSLDISVTECRISENNQILLLITKFMGNYHFLNDDNYYSTKINIENLDNQDKIKNVYLKIVNHVKDDEPHNKKSFQPKKSNNRPSLSSFYDVKKFIITGV